MRAPAAYGADHGVLVVVHRENHHFHAGTVAEQFVVASMRSFRQADIHETICGGGLAAQMHASAPLSASPTTRNPHRARGSS